MNWAAFHLASRKELHQAGKNERFLKTERGQKKEIVSKKKKKKKMHCFRQDYPPKGNGRDLRGRISH